MSTSMNDSQPIVDVKQLTVDFATGGGIPRPNDGDYESDVHRVGSATLSS